MASLVCTTPSGSKTNTWSLVFAASKNWLWIKCKKWQVGEMSCYGPAADSWQCESQWRGNTTTTKTSTTNPLGMHEPGRTFWTFFLDHLLLNTWMNVSGWQRQVGRPSWFTVCSWLYRLLFVSFSFWEGWSCEMLLNFQQTCGGGICCSR